MFLQISVLWQRPSGARGCGLALRGAKWGASRFDSASCWMRQIGAEDCLSTGIAVTSSERRSQQAATDRRIGAAVMKRHPQVTAAHNDLSVRTGRASAYVLLGRNDVPGQLAADGYRG